MRRFLLILPLLFPISLLLAQEIQDAGEAPADHIFPLCLVLEGAEFAADGCGSWRPDWPLELPPDVFKVLSGEITGVSAEGEGFSLDYRFNSLFGNPADGSAARQKQTEEFPLVLNGRMARVSIEYLLAEIHKVTLTFPDEESWKLEFLEYKDFFPSLVRASREEPRIDDAISTAPEEGSGGDTWYFIYLSRNGREIIESWFDEEGKALGAYSFSLIAIGRNLRIRAFRNLQTDDETGYFYDSRGFLTERSGPEGIFTVQYYRENLPRYWERRPNDSDGAGRFALQWDESGFLVRITGVSENSEPSAEGEPVDYRYEYILDEKGNWTERREIRMIRSMNLLVPSEGTVFRRTLEYRGLK